MFQFVDINSKTLPSEDDQVPYYEFEELKQRLHSTQEVYNGAINRILKNAYRAIKANLDTKDINEEILKPQIFDYLERLDIGNEINLMILTSI